jgi:hypothetical protein
MGPPGKVRGWLAQIAAQDPEPEIIETIRLVESVLDVQHAAAQQADETQIGDRYRKALAAIPPELRAMVETLVPQTATLPGTKRTKLPRRASKRT